MASKPLAAYLRQLADALAARGVWDARTFTVLRLFPISGPWMIVRPN